MRRPQTKKPKLDSSTLIQRHAQSLGFKSLDNYFQWCQKHHFPLSPGKHRKQLAREARFMKELAEANTRVWRPSPLLPKKRPLDRILNICDRSVELNDLQAAQEQHLWRTVNILSNHEPQIEPVNREVVKELACHAHNVKANFFEPIEASHLFGRDPSNTFLHGLAMIAAYRNAWRRPLGDWKPRTYNPRRQFASLLRHLFDQHGEIPTFFDSIWFANRSAENAERRAWFIHMGAGHNLRHCQLPISFNRNMANFFQQAPETLSVDQALRWAQVRGLGGSDRLAATVLETRLGQQFEHEDFWLTVLQWLVEQPLLDHLQIGPIIDYLHHQRYVDVDISMHERRPLQPNLSMKGRSPQSLLRQVEQWHRSLGRIARIGKGSDSIWHSSGIPSFRWAEGQAEHGNLKIWTIRELLSARELQVEGRKLKHCVASYIGSCAKRVNSIWTMELQQNGNIEKLLTLQVLPNDRVLCQARGKANRYPNGKESSVIRRWTDQARLRVTAPRV